ncbi:hypothetical protein OG394_16970 [Kribbella sp. NBC_01245]|uniref:hypothetical protein n=1 Tax=Kribbella sp. NBC_01245 TaxID=2903578 RepID=UPI002E2C3AE6|nr:hypothetical protein [Kribbella sp. NBC_01245]
MRVRSQVIRRSVAGFAGVALALGAAAALPANASSSGSSGADAVASSVAAPTLTITGKPTTVKAWQQFVLSGKATGTKAGTKVVVQRWETNKWVTFPASTVTTKSGTYSVRVKSGRIGAQYFRVATAKAASSAVKITVKK